MKKYNVSIDISECIEVEANSPEEASDKAFELLDKNDSVWNVNDAELNCEECDLIED